MSPTMDRRGLLVGAVRSVALRGSQASEKTVDQHEDLEKFLDKYADLDVHESAGWPAVVNYLSRFKRPNLAIVAVVAIVAVDAYKDLPASIIYASLISITLLGVFGGRGDG
jgi:hypothetical protein